MKGCSNAVVVKPGHRTELDDEYLALSVLKLFDLVLDVFGNDLFGSGPLAVAVLRSLVPQLLGADLVSVELP